MQKVFSNSQTVHVWCQQSQAFCQNSNDTLTGNGAILDSYSTTIALHYGDMVLTAEPSQFSVTTNRHTPSQYDVSPAKLIVLSDFFEWGKRYYSKRDFPKGGELKKVLLTDILEICKAYVKRKTDNTRQYEYNRLSNRLDDLQFVCNKFGLSYPAGYSSPDEILELSSDKLEKIKQAEKRKAQAEKRKLDKKRKEQQADFDKWLNGENSYLPQIFYGGAIYLTIRDNTVYTTRGADCPLEHVKKALSVYRRIVASGNSWKRNGETIRVGHFQIDTIHANGDVAAGCHYILAKEIERFINKWGL